MKYIVGYRSGAENTVKNIQTIEAQGKIEARKIYAKANGHASITYCVILG